MKLKKVKNSKESGYPTLEHYKKKRKFILQGLAVCTAIIGASSTYVLSENNPGPNSGEGHPYIHRLAGEIAVVENTPSPTPTPTPTPEGIRPPGIMRVPMSTEELEVSNEAKKIKKEKRN